jgi:parvulin-like peptidyl-prolyl cis-trans isomerase-like protein
MIKTFTRVLREPLVHFLLLGALLFLFSRWKSGPSDSGRIVVTRVRIEQLATAFSRSWQRPPTERELAGLVEDYVKEEVYVREAIATGLDRDDTIIRRRLRQKLEFLTEDALEGAAPSDEDLRGYLKAHADSFRVEPRVAFRQVFLDRNRRGAAAQEQARALLVRLSSARPGADISALGDSRMLPSVVELTPQSDVARVFGQEFAAQVTSLAPGSWAGPIASGYGLHLVEVTERVEGRLPELAEVRDAVARDWQGQRRKERKDSLFRSLLARYTVVVEPPAAGTRQAATGGKAR